MPRLRLATALVSLLFGTIAYANHPVLVEGTCDSPVFGTTLVSPGTCGDVDGDGRIGTAEDTDGADRIFGTLSAAVGPGTGAAAGTGANLNGTVTIVGSGRHTLPTSLAIPDAASGPTLLTIQAAPGVVALIDAVAQGDATANNNLRQNIAGFHITATGADDRIVLRNLTFRNWSEAVRVNGGARVVIENCVFEHNIDYGVRVMGSANVVVQDSQFFETGWRFGVTTTPVATPGTAIAYEGSSTGLVSKSVILNSVASSISSTSSGGATAVRYFQVVLGGNGSGIVNATAIGF